MKNLIAKLIFVKQGNVVKKIAVPASLTREITIGNGRSHRQVDVVLSSEFISRHHAKIFVDKSGRLFISDLESRNGTYVNSQRLRPHTPAQIQPGDVVTFANDASIQLMVSEPDTQTNAEPVQDRKFNTLETSLKNNKTITIGRSSDCDIVFRQQNISRKHAVVTLLEDGGFTLEDTSRNGTYVNGKLITGKVHISTFDTIQIGNNKFTLDDKIEKSGEEVKIGEPVTKGYSLNEKLQHKNKIIIGRSPEADIFIDDNQVSRRHAEVSKEGNNYFVCDLGSTNGTYINGKLIHGKTKFTSNDTIVIGLHAFKLNEAAEDLSLNTAIRAENIEVQYPNGYKGLKKMSVNIPHKAFVALMGPSGCGKTTLMRALNGDNPATLGKVYIHGLELTSNYDLLKRKIGYVPQDDIVHKELSVEKSLFFAAKLRLPDDTTNQEISRRIDEVLTSLNINDPKIRETRVSSLSGGQRKRVSIAVELLNKPSILFLDEPTSPLDPETIEDFLTAIRQLTENGTTVIMVTHKPDDLDYVHRVIFLTTKGYIAYYGDKDKLLEYFKTQNIIGVYSLLSKTGKNEELVLQWYDKWNKQNVPDKAKDESAGEIRKKRNESPLKQFFWLTKRYFNIKANDKANMFLLMLQPIIIAGLLVFIFDKLQLGVLFLMAVSAIWFGVSNAAKEIVGEMPIYKRERMFNLNILTYLFSKITVLSVIALVQVIVFVLIVKMKYSAPTATDIQLVNVSQYIFFMFYLAFSSTLLGLLLSAVFDTTEKVMTVVPIALMPQIMLAGVVTRIDNIWKEGLSYLTLGRWGTEGFSRIQDNYDNYQIERTLLINETRDTVFTEKPCPPCPGMNEKAPSFKLPESITFKYDTLIDTTTKSMYNSVPVVSDDTLLITEAQDTTFLSTSEMKYDKVSAMDQLGFYDTNLIQSGDLMGWFDGFQENLLAISMLNLIVFIGLYISLKKKDSL